VVQTDFRNAVRQFRILASFAALNKKRQSTGGYDVVALGRRVVDRGTLECSIIQ
jgi:hypothetical protein